MASQLEEIVCRSLRTLLKGVPIGGSVADSGNLQDLLSGLEFFIPEVFGELNRDWDDELDGFIPVMARKTANQEVEIFGLCILITDQTLTPIHLQLQISPTSDEVSWLQCRLGERGEQGMVRLPYGSRNRAAKRLYAFEGKEDMIDWVYKIIIGQRRTIVDGAND